MTVSSDIWSTLLAVASSHVIVRTIVMRSGNVLCFTTNNRRIHV